MSSLEWLKRAYGRSHGLTAASGRGGQRGAERRTIMVVDDNIKMIEALSRVLDGKYTIVACCSAREVEQRFNDDVKLVILDIKMAPDDGMAIFALLRQKSARVPIVFHTAYPGGSEIVARMRELAAQECLMKGDYSLGHLEEIIERAIRRGSTQEDAGSGRGVTAD